jgi:orotate phosphoribosyltransferase-like protein
VVADAGGEPPGSGEGRRSKVRELWLQGLTLERIGEELNVTRERARQLLSDLNLRQAGRFDRRVVWLSEQHGHEIVEGFLRLRDDAKLASDLGTGLPS